MIVIGRRDYLNLPSFGLEHIQAKIDTGAYGCSLHCHEIELVKIDGKEVLRFKLLDPKHPEYNDKFNYASDFSDKTVKSSIGIAEHRYTIKTEACIFNQTFTVEFSLTDRANMKYPILLGRKFLRNRFVADVSLKNISRRRKIISYEVESKSSGQTS
jgi:hypothetical protein